MQDMQSDLVNWPVAM